MYYKVKIAIPDTIDIIDVVDYLIETLQNEGVLTFTYQDGSVELDQDAYEVFRGLPEDSDGHIDEQNRMWLCGSEHPGSIEPDTTITTSYGTWANWFGNITLRDHVIEALSGHVNDYDVDTIVTQYRNAINQALAHIGITLCGDDFHGPHPHRNEVDIIDIIADVDFWSIVERNDIS